MQLFGSKETSLSDRLDAFVPGPKAWLTEGRVGGRQVHRNRFVVVMEHVRVRCLLYFRWIIYTREASREASPYLQYLDDLAETEEALLLPAGRTVSLVPRPPPPPYTHKHRERSVRTSSIGTTRRYWVACLILT